MSTSVHARLAKAMPAAFVVAILAIFAATADFDGGNNDVHSANLASWRIAATGEPWLEGVDIDQAGLPRELVWIDEASNGHEVIFRSPGVVAVGIPAYWLSGAGTAPADFSNAPGALTAVLLATFAVWLFYLCVSPLLSRPSALTATGVFGLATPIWTVAGDSLWTHSVTVVGILGMAWAAQRDRWLLVGLFGGVALWGRLHTAIIVAVLGVAVAVLRRKPTVAITTGSVSLVFLGFASLWSHWFYGTWSPSGGYAGDAYLAQSARGVGDGIADHAVNHVGLWISPDRGILVWSPVLLLLLPAVLRAWRDLPDWARWLAVGGLAYTLVQGQLNGFTGGSGYYGYRLTLELLACVAPVFALSVHRMGRWAKELLGPVVGLQVGVMALGAMANALFVLEENAWTDNSVWLAMREIPLVNVWIVLMTFIGWLGGLYWRSRVVVTQPMQAGELTRLSAGRP